MFTKDNILLVVVVLVALGCAYLYREMKSAKADIATCKSFSVSLANRISSAPAHDAEVKAPAPVPVPAPEPVVEEKKED